MRVLRGTLTFVLGMIIGIILFVIAIGGAVAIIGTSITVGELQGNFTEEDVISPDSQLYNQTLLEAIQSVIGDVQSMDTLTMRTLYEHYGIELLNGISGIDFTSKEFYDTGLSTLLDDLSIVTNSFTLNDISSLVGVDFNEYGLPVLSDNLDKNLQTALDNILSSLNGDLTIRDINTNFGIDVGVEDNALIKSLQDVSMSNFGSVVNALPLSTLIEADYDTFIPQGNNRVYQKVDNYVALSASELKDGTPAVGVESYYAGATENEDGTWTMIEKELRYVKKTNAEGVVTYIVDNSCYSEDFDIENSDKGFYRHVLYEQATPSSSVSDLAILTYHNRIASIDGDVVVLRNAGFTPLSELENINLASIATKVNPDGTITFDASDFAQTNSDLFFMLDKTITKDSLLRKYNEENDKDSEDVVKRTQSFIRVHEGTSEAILQIVAPMTVSELQNADDFLGSLKVGDVVDTENEDTAKVLKTLKDCKLTEIGTKINDLPLEDLMDITDESSTMMQSIRNHGCTLNNIGEKINEFTIGEVIDVEYDTLIEATDGAYVIDQVLVKYNQYVHEGQTRYYYDGETLTEITSESILPEGTTIYTYIDKYRLYNAETDSGKTRYNIEESATAIAIQMMAKRGYTLNSIGSEINKMGFDELVRIKPDSSLIMRSLAKHGATLENIGDTVDTLLIDEVIEINDESATIMKSLKARGCTITELGNVAKDLTLAETTDIVFDKYTKASEGSYGKYVKVEDATRYILYDANNPNFADAQRYNANDEGGYVEAEGGKYTHPFYFTLYNPAVHGTDCTTYNIVAKSEGEPKSSSKVLQRLAYCSIDKFSDEFDNLTLGDVLDIDIDILARDAETEADKSYFYYDNENSLYMRQAGADLTDVDSEYRNFFVATEGESSSVLKRLAYVKINDLSTAMEKVMKDMMLSEIVDIYTESAVSIRTDATTIAETDMFIVHPVGKEGEGEDERYYTFVYNTAGKYIKRDHGFYEVSPTKSGTVTYSYQAITNTTDFAAAATNQNIYYKNGDEYVYNLALCTYVAMQNKDLTHSSISGTGEIIYPITGDKLYTRISGGADVTADKYDNSESNLFILLNGVYQAYDASNLVHADMQIYKLRTGTCYVEITTPDDGTGNYKYKGTNEATGESKETLYAKQYCETIYVQNAEGDKVYIDGHYVDYGNDSHSGLIRYKAATGYLATANECYLKDITGYVSPLSHLGNRVSVDGDGNHQKSERVLQTLSSSTIGGINDTIKDAKVGDLLEIEPGSLFEDFADSKLTEVSADLQNALKNWTIGDLARKANITSMQPEVKSALDGVTLDIFFKSLTYSPTAGIVVDLEKAYGYNS